MVATEGNPAADTSSSPYVHLDDQLFFTLADRGAQTDGFLTTVHSQVRAEHRSDPAWQPSPSGFMENVWVISNLASKRKAGARRPIVYGQPIRIIHYVTGAALTMTRGKVEQRSGTDSQNLQAYTSDPGGDAAAEQVWEILPASRARSKGDPVQVNDIVELTNQRIKFSLEQSTRRPYSNGDRNVVGTSSPGRWRVHRFSSFVPPDVMRHASVVALCHRESDGVLSLYAPAQMRVLPGMPYLRLADEAELMSVLPTHLADTWEFETVSEFTGGAIGWYDVIYVRHFLTGRYLAISDSDCLLDDIDGVPDAALPAAAAPVAPALEELGQVTRSSGMLVADMGKVVRSAFTRTVGKVFNAIKDRPRAESRAISVTVNGMVRSMNIPVVPEAGIYLSSTKSPACLWRMWPVDATAVPGEPVRKLANFRLRHAVARHPETRRLGYFLRLADVMEPDGRTPVEPQRAMKLTASSTFSQLDVDLDAIIISSPNATGTLSSDGALTRRAIDTGMQDSLANTWYGKHLDIDLAEASNSVARVAARIQAILDDLVNLTRPGAVATLTDLLSQMSELLGDEDKIDVVQQAVLEQGVTFVLLDALYAVVRMPGSPVKTSLTLLGTKQESSDAVKWHKPAIATSTSAVLNAIRACFDVLGAVAHNNTAVSQVVHEAYRFIVDCLSHAGDQDIGAIHCLRRVFKSSADLCAKVTATEVERFLHLAIKRPALLEPILRLLRDLVLTTSAAKDREGLGSKHWTTMLVLQNFIGDALFRKPDFAVLKHQYQLESNTVALCINGRRVSSLESLQPSSTEADLKLKGKRAARGGSATPGSAADLAAGGTGASNKRGKRLGRSPAGHSPAGRGSPKRSPSRGPGGGALNAPDSSSFGQGTFGQHLNLIQLYGAVTLGRNDANEQLVRTLFPLKALIKAITMDRINDTLRQHLVAVFQESYVARTSESEDREDTFYVKYTKFWSDRNTVPDISAIYQPPGSLRDTSFDPFIQWMLTFMETESKTTEFSVSRIKLFNQVMDTVYSMFEYMQFHTINHRETLRLAAVLRAIVNWDPIEVFDEAGIATTVDGSESKAARKVRRGLEESRFQACRILSIIDKYLLNERLTRLFVEFTRAQVGSGNASSGSTPVSTWLKVMNEWSLRKYTGDWGSVSHVMLNIKNFNLNKAALTLLDSVTRDINVTLDELADVSVLVGEASASLARRMPVLVSRLTDISLTDETVKHNKRRAFEFVKELTIRMVGLTKDNVNAKMDLPAKAVKPIPSLQNLYRSFNVHVPLFRIVSSPFHEDMRDLFLAVFEFMTYWVMGNQANGAILVKYMNLLQSLMGRNLLVANVLRELLDGARYSVPASFTQRQCTFFVDLIVTKGRQARYTNLLHKLCSSSGKPIKTNQTWIIDSIYENGDKVFQWFKGPEGREERAKLMKDTPDLAKAARDNPLLYHVSFINLIAECCLKRNARAVGLVRDQLTLQEVLDNLDPKAALRRDIRRPYWGVLRNVYLDADPLELTETERDLLPRVASIFAATLQEVMASANIANYIAMVRMALLPTLNSFVTNYVNFDTGKEEFRWLVTTIQVASADLNELLRGMMNLAETSEHVALKSALRTSIELMTGDQNALETEGPVVQRAAALQRKLLKEEAAAKEAEAAGSGGVKKQDEDKMVMTFWKAWLADGRTQLEARIGEQRRLFKATLSSYPDQTMANLVTLPERAPDLDPEFVRYVIECMSSVLHAKPSQRQLDALRTANERLTDAASQRNAPALVRALASNVATTVAVELEAARRTLFSALSLSAASADDVEESKKPIKEQQTRLNDLGATRNLLAFAGSTHNELRYDALRLLKELLEDGNVHVQEVVLDAIEDGEILHDMATNIAEVTEEARSNTWWITTGDGDSNADKAEALANITPERILDMNLKVIKELCEGHNLRSQDLLRDQETQSINIVRALVAYLDVLTPSFMPNPFQMARVTVLNDKADKQAEVVNEIQSSWYDPLEDLLDTILETVQGPCKGNQRILTSQLATETIKASLLLPMTMEMLIEPGNTRSDKRSVQIIVATREEREYMEKIGALLLAALEGTQYQSQIDLLNSRGLFPAVLDKVRVLHTVLHRWGKHQAVWDTVAPAMTSLGRVLAYLSMDPSQLLSRSDRAAIESFDLVLKQVGRIEVLRDDAVVPVFFERVPLSKYHWNQDTKEILWGASRANAAEKLEDMLGMSDLMLNKARLRQQVDAQPLLSKLTNDRSTRTLRFIANVMVVVMNVMMVIVSESSVTDAVRDRMITMIYVLGAIMSLTVVVQTLSFLFLANRIAVRIKGLLLKREHENGDVPWHIWLQRYVNAATLYKILLLSACIQAFASYPGIPYWFAFQLIDLVVQSPVLLSVLRSVTKNAKSLFLTFLLVVLIVYFYAIFAFLYFADTLNEPEDPSDPPNQHCVSLGTCWTLIFGQFPSGGDYLREKLFYTGNSPGEGWELIFQISFFVVVMVVLLNILFGIIIDTFSELRGDRQEIEDDLGSRCFICGLESSVFERDGNGFEFHVTREHNVADYLDFYIRLHEMHDEHDETEFDGTESFAWEQVAAGKTNWLPISRAVSLDTSQLREALDSGESDVPALFSALFDKLRDMSTKIGELESDLASKHAQLNAMRTLLMQQQ